MAGGCVAGCWYLRFKVCFSEKKLGKRGRVV